MEALLFGALLSACFAQPMIPAWPNSIFYKDISLSNVDTRSAQIIAQMKAAGPGIAGSGCASGLAWGTTSGQFQTDWSLIPVWLKSGDTFACADITGNAVSNTDCDSVTGLKFPLPANGAIEGTSGYGACSGDCHLLVYDEPRQLLWESYGSSVSGGVLTSDCVIIWDLTRDYPSNLRGDQCTSVDAAGFPIAPLLATADEIAAGTIGHALRLALPNDMLQSWVYAHPATHASSVLYGPDPSPFYGMRMRLKSTFSNSAFPNPSGNNMTALGVIFNALKAYGMFMADGSSQHAGGIPFMIASDQFAAHKYADMNLDTHGFFGLSVDNFEIVEPLDTNLGRAGRINLTFDCVKTQPSTVPSRAFATCGPTGTCSDGLQNGDETGIDCGGRCLPARPCQSFVWQAGNYGDCNATCGGGYQWRNVTCVDGNTGFPTPGMCDAIHPPTTNQTCNIDPCASYNWVAGPYGNCSTICGGGTQTREVDCVSSIGNSTVDPSLCSAATKPTASTSCNTDQCQMSRWVAGNWTLCSALCASGSSLPQQTRNVLCLDANDMPSPGMCSAQPMPPMQQSCNTEKCTTTTWRPCPFYYPCTAQCNGGDGMLGIKYRDIFCVDAANNLTLDPSLCDNATRPQSQVTSCNPQPCTTANWMANDNWGPCQPRSALDATLVRTRSFHCHDAKGNLALLDLCKPYPKPIGELPCVPNTCLDIPPTPTTKGAACETRVALSIFVLCTSSALLL